MKTGNYVMETRNIGIFEEMMSDDKELQSDLRHGCINEVRRIQGWRSYGDKWKLLIDQIKAELH